MASTPKCSHTAGQNCSLQVMKSSSRLGRAEEGFSNAAHEGAEGHSQRSCLNLLLHHLPSEPGSFGTSTCPQTSLRASSEHEGDGRDACCTNHPSLLRPAKEGFVIQARFLPSSAPPCPLLAFGRLPTRQVATWQGSFS